jgi:hypothetical protein
VRRHSQDPAVRRPLLNVLLLLLLLAPLCAAYLGVHAPGLSVTIDGERFDGPGALVVLGPAVVSAVVLALLLVALALSGAGLVVLAALALTAVALLFAGAALLAPLLLPLLLLYLLIKALARPPPQRPAERAPPGRGYPLFR